MNHNLKHYKRHPGNNPSCLHCENRINFNIDNYFYGGLKTTHKYNEPLREKGIRPNSNSPRILNKQNVDDTCQTSILLTLTLIYHGVAISTVKQICRTKTDCAGCVAGWLAAPSANEDS